jgi:hypothetical protein
MPPGFGALDAPCWISIDQSNRHSAQIYQKCGMVNLSDHTFRIYREGTLKMAQNESRPPERDLY